MKRTPPLRRLFAKLLPAKVGWIVTLWPSDGVEGVRRFTVAIASAQEARNKALWAGVENGRRRERRDYKVRLQEASVPDLAGLRQGEIKPMNPA